MQQKHNRIRIGLTLLSIVLLASLTVGSRFCQPASEAFMTDTLKKASLAFAGARAINALVSVAQKVETGGSVKFLGTGGSASLAPFEWLDPLNDLVERFSLVMLACCVAMGVLLFLNQTMPWVGLVVFLPVSGLILLFAFGINVRRPGSGRQLFRIGYKLLAITALATFMVPMMTIVNFLAYDFFLEPTYETASASMTGTKDTLAAIKTDAGILQTAENIQQKISGIKLKMEEVVNHMLDLITVFLIQTILLPLFMFWLIIKSVSFIAGSRAPLPAESNFDGHR